MKWFILLLGLSAMAFGGWWGWIGWNIVQVERGWSAVIAGAAIASSGLLMVGLSALMARVDTLIKLFRNSAQANTAPERIAPQNTESSQIRATGPDLESSVADHPPAAAVVPGLAEIPPVFDRMQAKSGSNLPAVAGAGLLSAAAAVTVATKSRPASEEPTLPPIPGDAAPDQNIELAMQQLAADAGPDNDLSVPPPPEYHADDAFNTDEPADPLQDLEKITETGSGSDQRSDVIVLGDESFITPETTISASDNIESPNTMVFARRPLPENFGWPDPPEKDEAAKNPFHQDDTDSGAGIDLPMMTPPRAKLPQIDDMVALSWGSNDGADTNRAPETDEAIPANPPPQTQSKQPFEPDEAAIVRPDQVEIEAASDAEQENQIAAPILGNGRNGDKAPTAPIGTPADNRNDAAGVSNADPDEAWFEDLLGGDQSQEMASSAVESELPEMPEEGPPAPMIPDTVASRDTNIEPDIKPESSGDIKDDKDDEIHQDANPTGDPDAQELARRTADIQPIDHAADQPDSQNNDPKLEADKDGGGVTQRELLRSYESQGVQYYLYADGSIDAHAPGGDIRFSSLDELRNFIESRQKQ